jgi:hypothetical protein
MIKLIVAFHNFVNAPEEDKRQFEIYLLHCSPTKLHITLPVNNWDTTKCVQAKDQDLTKEHKILRFRDWSFASSNGWEENKRVSGIQTNRQWESGASLHSQNERKWNEAATPNFSNSIKIRSVSVWWKRYNIRSLECRNRYPHWINAWGTAI